MSHTSHLKPQPNHTDVNNLNNNIDVQLADQLQKLAETIADLEIKLDKATKDRERKKLTKAIAEKKALYESLSAGLNDAASEDTKDNSSTPEDTPKSPEEAPAPTPAPEDTPKDNLSPEDTPKESKVKATSEEPKVKVKETKTQTPTSSAAPKVSAKDTAPAPAPKTILDMAQDENGNPTKGFSVIVYTILAVVLGAIGWWYLYTDTSTVAGAAMYEQATARLKEDIQPAWYRWHSWDVKVKGEAIVRWMPAYRAVYVDNGFTSTKGEATLYACGCVLRALTKKGMSIGDAALRLDSMSFEQFKAALDNDTTLDPSEARAIKRALDN